LKKLISLLFIFLILSITLTIAAQSTNIGLITEVENPAVPSYNKAVESVLKALESGGNFNSNFLKTELLTDYLPKLSYLAADQADLIVAIGPSMQQSVKETAQLYSEKDFLIIDGRVELDNVLSIDFAVEEGAFLAGVIAALKSESDVIAFIGERENNRSKKFEAGFAAGAKELKPEIKLLSEYLSRSKQNNTARERTDQLYYAGADVIFYYSGSASEAIVASAEENDFYLIGVQNKLAEPVSDKLLTNIIKNIPYLLEKESNNFANNNHQSGFKTYDLANSGLMIDQDTADKMLAESILDKVELYKNKLINGAVEIP